MSGFAQFTPASRRLARPAASVLLAALLGVQLAGAGLPAAAQSVAPAVSAQPALRQLFSAPIGVTEAESLRIQIAAPPGRDQSAPRSCDAGVAVEVLDAENLSRVLATFGPATLRVGESFRADFAARPGPQPARLEVVLRTTIVRRSAREDAQVACPLTGSVQVLDPFSGRVLIIHGVHDIHMNQGA